MNRKTVSGLMLTLLLSALALAFNVTKAQVVTIGIGVYWDEECTNPVSSINWGSLTPGSNKKLTVFVRNEGSEAVVLSLASSNWNPQKTADFLALAWNYAGEEVEPFNVVSVTLGLQVSNYIVEVDNFSFDIIISGTRRLTSSCVISAVGSIVYIRVIGATVDFHPQALNLGSNGQGATAYIQLPEGYGPADIDASTILLNGTIAPVLDCKYGFVRNPSEYLVDHNDDGVLERMVKFDRAAVQSFIYDQGFRNCDVALIITGKLSNDTAFEGTDNITVFANAPFKR